MEVNNLAVKMSSLEQKVKKLLTEFDVVRKEARLLREENAHLKSIIIDKDKEIADFQNKIKISTIVSNLGVDYAETSELKELIDGYIKEIDRCLIHLSQ
ncbi:MAG: hypothetical protein MI784_15770 [Cytophagales bacterium]|nr:hypothetical protein [Cytophagales bacterium]